MKFLFHVQKIFACDSRLMKSQQQLTRYIRRRPFTNLQDRKSVFAPFLQFAVYTCCAWRFCAFQAYSEFDGFILQCGQLLLFMLSVIQILAIGQQLTSFRRSSKYHHTSLFSIGLSRYGIMSKERIYCAARTRR